MAKRKLTEQQVAKNKAGFKEILAQVDKEREVLIQQWYDRYKPLVKQKALQLGIQLAFTQGGMQTRVWPYPPGYDEFVDFLNDLSDIYRVEWYFHVNEAGEFAWFMDKD